jgi:hypothetical protein
VVCDFEPAAFSVHYRYGLGRLLTRVEKVSTRFCAAPDSKNATGYAAGGARIRSQQVQSDHAATSAIAHATTAERGANREGSEADFDLDAKLYAVDQNYRFSKAVYDAEKYEYEEAFAKKASNAQKLGEKVKATEKEMNDYKAELDKVTLDQRAATAELDKYLGQRNTLQKESETLRADYNRLQTG